MHEVGRNADFFDPEAGAAAEGRLEHRLRFGAPALERPRHEGAPRDRLQVHAEGLQADLQARRASRLGNGVDIDIKPNEANQQLHAYAVLQRAHQDHLVRAAPARAGRADVPRSDLGLQHPDAELRRLRPQLGARLRLHRRFAPLLPKGTILHIIGYMDNSPTNKNVPDPRNWQGSGNRSVANMFIDLGIRVALTDEQFQKEMAKRAREAAADEERQRHRLPAVHGRRAAGDRLDGKPLTSAS